MPSMRGQAHVRARQAKDTLPYLLGMWGPQRLLACRAGAITLRERELCVRDRDRAVAIPERLRNHPEHLGEMDQPSYWKKRVEFLDQRTPEFIQKVRDEISRRYIVMTDPHSPEVQRQLFKAMEMCRMSGVLPNLQKGVNARQRRVELHGLTEISRNKNTPWNVTRSIAKFVGKPNKTRRGRKSRKVRRTRKRR